MTNRLRLLIVVSTILILSGQAYGWDGTENETGNSVEIEKGNLVREGLDIELYDSGTGTYRDMTVERIERSGGGVEIEMYDNETSEYRTYEFED